jgi:hypothetical protein
MITRRGRAWEEWGRERPGPDRPAHHEPPSPTVYPIGEHLSWREGVERARHPWPPTEPDDDGGW